MIDSPNWINVTPPREEHTLFNWLAAIETEFLAIE